MIERWYEVSCDACGACLNHYIGNKPSVKELKFDGFVVVKNKVFCNNNCANKYNK